MIFGIPYKDVVEFLLVILNTILVYLTRNQSIRNGQHIARLEAFNDKN